MARIRSIHPNTPTDPDLAAIPIPGRLFFIYSWGISDDAGNLERSPRGMKMALFPGDDSVTVKKIEKLVDVLIAGRFYTPYEVDGKTFLHVRNFARYQKIDHPTPPRFPLYPGQSYTYHVREGNSWISKTVKASDSTNVPLTDGEHTPNVRAGLGRDSEGKGKEGIGGVQGTDHEPADGPRPLGAEAAASEDPGNGNGTGTKNVKEDLPGLHFIDQLSKLKRDSLKYAVERFNKREWTKRRVEQHLHSSEFNDEELIQVNYLFEEERVEQ